jgi:hypothetical protein
MISTEPYDSYLDVKLEALVGRQASAARGRARRGRHRTVDDLPARRSVQVLSGSRCFKILSEQIYFILHACRYRVRRYLCAGARWFVLF